MPRNRERKYTAASYSAQYGIPLEDAEDLVGRCGSHSAVERAIYAMLAADPELKRRALLLDGMTATEEEREQVERLLRRGGISAVTGREW